MKQLLRRLLLNLSGLFKNSKPIQAVGFSTEDATVGEASQEKLIAKLLKGNKVTHEDVRNLSKTFFNAEIKSSFYCFKGGGPYGIVMELTNIGMVTDKDDKLCDIILNMQDTSMGTSLTLTLSVKDLNELLVPFFPKTVAFH